MNKVPQQLPTGAPALFLLAGVGNLALAVWVLYRARRTRGALPLAFLCLSLSIWEAGEAIIGMRDGPQSRLDYIRLVGSALAPSFLFHYVLDYVRRQQDYRRHLWMFYGVSALFGLITAGAVAFEPLKEFVDGEAWGALYIAIFFPFLIFSFVLVSRRLREVSTQIERNALNLIRLAIAIGAFTGVSSIDLKGLNPLPNLGHIGSVAMTVILAVAILRMRLLEREIPFRQINSALAGIFAVVVLIFILYERVLSEVSRDWLALGTLLLVTAVLVMHQVVWAPWFERQEQKRRLTLLGSMAAGVAHEIKNPLASIRGAAQFVQKELEGMPTTEESRDYLKMVVQETDRLNLVVENFLDFAKPLTPSLQRVELGALVQNVVALQQAAVKTKIEFNPEGAPDIVADPALLRIALGNIIGNATEAATDTGEVLVRIRWVERDRPYVAIEVQDNGPGLPKERADDVFQPFFTTKTKGTGLGLAIARRIAEGHGGEISAENAQPTGARFTLLLPAQP